MEKRKVEIDDIDEQLEKSIKRWKKEMKAPSQEKITKTIEKSFKKFLKKIKVPKNATPEQIKEYILNYASTTNDNIWEIRLSQELRNDKDFMIELLKARPNYTIVFSPTMEQYEDNDYLVEYAKIKYEFFMENGDEYEVSRIVELKNDDTDYIMGLAKAIPTINVIDGLYHSHKGFLISSKYDFQKVFSQLPAEFVCEQARKFGNSVLTCIPKTYEHYEEVLKNAVECDGFKCLQNLEVGEILAHKDLIIRAGELFGKEELEKFIRVTVSPEKYRRDHAVQLGHERTLKYYAQIQKVLYRDPSVQKILNEGNDKNNNKNSENDKNL